VCFEAVADVESADVVWVSGTHPLVSPHVIHAREYYGYAVRLEASRSTNEVRRFLPIGRKRQ
jgi:hypothetical protein